MIKKLIFNTAKEAFRKGFKQYKSEARRQKKLPKQLRSIVVPYDLVKKDIKRKIKSTKFMDKETYLKAPKTKSIPKGGPRPQIFGKAYASDKKGKTMNITLPKKERAAIQEGISQSVRKFLSERIGRKAKGGIFKAKRGRFI